MEKDNENTSCVIGYYQKLASFEFIFPPFSAIFTKSGVLLNILQLKIADIGYCTNKICEC